MNNSTSSNSFSAVAQELGISYYSKYGGRVVRCFRNGVPGYLGGISKYVIMVDGGLVTNGWVATQFDPKTYAKVWEQFFPSKIKALRALAAREVPSIA